MAGSRSAGCKHALLTLSDEETQALADAFAAMIRRRSYTCYACAIMPDHVHLLIRKHRDRAETMIGHHGTRVSANSK